MDDINLTIPPNHGKFNKSIEIKLRTKQKGFMSGGLFGSTSTQTFRVPPLNAVIDSGFGKGPKDSKPFKGFQAGNSVDNVDLIPFLNWTSLRSNSFDDPNKYRTEQLEVFKLLEPMNQDCCGACWAVSSTMAFADRYGIANDIQPINPSVISVMSCCTKQMHKSVFAVVDTPDCDIMSSYNELKRSGNSMGMCSGGIPYSAGLTIMRNGLPNDNKTKYTSELFGCSGDTFTPSFPNMNTALIDKYSCSEKLFENTQKIKMESEPIYISSSQGPPSHYPELMKKELLEGGPLVGGYMVLGDFLGLNSDGNSLGSDGDKTQIMNWDTTGKVYVPGAYNKLFPFVSVNGVGGSSTISFNKQEGKQTQAQDQGVKAKAAIGEIFCGFHAVVIVGWGELDAKFVENKDIKFITGKDGKKKLPFWICRNSWGTQWPTEDYYSKGIEVIVDNETKTLKVPKGYWLHAMYPNESMAMDVPINYEGIDYGSTMVMIPQKVNKLETVTKGALTPKNNGCNTTWEDSEGYNCSQYSEYGWCNQDGNKGPGWKDKWGDFDDFKSDGYDASDICCQCGSNSSGEIPEISKEAEDTVTISIFYVSSLCIVIIFLLILLYVYRDELE